MNNTPLTEYNVTGQDFGLRSHFKYSGPPIIDVHARVTLTRPDETREGDSTAAELMLAVAAEFGVARTYSRGPPQDIAPLRERLGTAIAFNGSISKKPDEPDDAEVCTLDRFLQSGIELVKLWAAPRGRDRGLLLDAPWRIEALKRAGSAGIRVVMVHVGDPDFWWTHSYRDMAKFGTKADQYVPLRKMIDLFPDLTWIGAHCHWALEDGSSADLVMSDMLSPVAVLRYVASHCRPSDLMPSHTHVREATRTRRGHPSVD